MKKIKYQIRNFFGFSKKETNGFILLVILISLLLIIPFAVEILYQPGNENTNRDKVMLDSMVSILEASSNEVSFNKSQKKYSKLSLQYFNPNDATEEQMREILGAKIARTIVRFRAKGGKFFIKKDLSKIYGVDAKTFERAEKYILLPSEFVKREYKHPERTFSTKTISTFDINQADTSSLQKIKGIGKVLSARIIKYRNKLGGFISMDQVNEVYGLESNVITELNKYTYVDKNFISTKISINTATYSSLAAHPYIGKKYAGVILNYRKQHVLYNSLDELKLIPSINSEELGRMIPYLSL